MSPIPLKLTAVATTAALAAGGAGVVLNADAAKSVHHKNRAAHAGKKQPLVRAVRRSVHAELTVPTKDGFKQVTIDRGFLKAAVGNQLTISESTRKIQGKDVTVSVPADAKVRVDKKAAHLSDLKAGQHVAVLQLPKKTLVRAFTPKQP